MHQKETHTQKQQHGNIERLTSFMLLTISSITYESHFWLGYIHANKLLFDPSKKKTDEATSNSSAIDVRQLDSFYQIVEVLFILVLRGFANLD